MVKTKFDKKLKELRKDLVNLRPFYPNIKISEPKQIGTTGFISYFIKFGGNRFEIISNLLIKTPLLELYLKYELLGRFSYLPLLMKKVIRQQIILDKQKQNT